MSRTPWLLVALLVSAGLAGCLHEDGSSATVEIGDLVRIRSIAKYASNGTVIQSTFEGDVPQGASLSDLPADQHDERWVVAWRQPRGNPSEPKQGVLTTLTFLDLTSNGVYESIFHVRRDFVRNASGQIEATNARPRLFDNPVANLSKIQTPVAPGLYGLYLDMSEGETREVTLPPKQAFGPHQPSKVQTKSRVLSNQSRELTVPPEPLKQRSNFTESTEEGDVIGITARSGQRLDARVREIGNRTVEIYLLVQEGQSFKVNQRPWNGTVINVTESTYDIKQNPKVGQHVENGRVVEVNPWTYVVDKNAPAAGERVTFEVQIAEHVPVTKDEDLRATPRKPIAKGGAPNDVAIPNTAGLVVASDRGIFISFARNRTAIFGASWFPISEQLNGSNVRALEVSRHASGTWFAAVAGKGFGYSTDHGRTWTFSNEGLPSGAPVTGVTSSHRDEDLLYALVRGEGIYRSTDRGGSWQKASSNLTRARVIDLDPGDDDTLWAVRDGELLRSTDRGRTWTTRDVPDRPVRYVDHVTARERMVVANGSVFHTIDDGANWTESSLPVDAIAHAPTNPSWALAYSDSGEREGEAFMRQSFTPGRGALWKPIPLR